MADDESNLISLELPPNTTVEALKLSVQAEAGIPKAEQNLYHNGRLLNDDTKTMEQLSIGDGEMLALNVGGRTEVPVGQQQQRRPNPQPAQSGDRDPETLRLQLLGNAAMRAQVADQQPDLVAVIDNPERFASVLRQMQVREREEQARRTQHIADLNADPFDIDAQMRIAEMIRQERVQENLQNAIENTPEGKPPPRS